jgi:hypothetical protein
MEILIIIILIFILLYVYKTNNNETFSNTNIKNDINNILKNMYKTDFSKITDISNKIDNLKQTSNINLTNNFTNTGLLKIISPNNTNNKNNQVRILGNINFTNKNNPNTYLDIFPKYFIMIWAKQIKDIPKGWALCDGNIYTVDKDNNVVVSSNNSENNTISIKTPNLVNILLRGGGFQNKIVGDIKHKIKLSNIPNHGHTLATKFDKKNKTYKEGVGFDYENILTNDEASSYLMPAQDRSIKCQKNWLFDRGDICELSPSEFNKISLAKMKLTNPNAKIYYGSDNMTYNPYLPSDDPSGINVLIPAQNEKIPFTYGPDSGGGVIYTDDRLWVDKTKNEIKNETTEISLMPSYCSLYYIMKIS